MAPPVRPSRDPPLSAAPPVSGKMAKVSELYDVTWEGNLGRARAEGRSPGKGSEGPVPSGLGAAGGVRPWAPASPTGGSGAGGRPSPAPCLRLRSPRLRLARRPGLGWRARLACAVALPEAVADRQARSGGFWRRRRTRPGLRAGGRAGPRPRACEARAACGNVTQAGSHPFSASVPVESPSGRPPAPSHPGSCTSPGPFPEGLSPLCVIQTGV